MRRAWFATAVVLLVGLTTAPALAGDHIEVTNRVLQGTKVRIKVHDCVSGKGWEAWLHVKVVDPDRPNRALRADSDAANNTGLDIVKFRITDQFPRGLYTAKVRCEHDFPQDPTQVFFDEQENFRVVEGD